ncbi:amidoligase family protein [Primorskyibacter sp. 2E107]|uniref:amidoligase family protein n=1 Tax=Primorskyibacter sp. 2E107 TaxID=3403458 RepID=UPI003AF49DB0
MTITFEPLPTPAGGSARKTGIEIEFSGLTEARCAEIVQRELGGEIETEGTHTYRVKGSALGDVRVELDIFLRNKKGGRWLENGLDLARNVVPVEIITEPLTPEQIGALDALRAVLRDEGAAGSTQGVFLGFGVHLNPALSGDAAHDCATILAYGLLEDYLRERYPIDTTRRLLPFVDPWPRALVDRLAEVRSTDMSEIMEIYAGETTSRNHGLDLLPVFKDAAPDNFDKSFKHTDGHVSGRPAFHVRLPDCRIDEESWSLKEAWNMWQTVERVAQNRALMDGLCEDRLALKERFLATRGSWSQTVRTRLGNAGETV